MIETRLTGHPDKSHHQQRVIHGHRLEGWGPLGHLGSRNALRARLEVFFFVGGLGWGEWHERFQRREEEVLESCRCCALLSSTKI